MRSRRSTPIRDTSGAESSLVKMVSSALTIGSGGSAGREGPTAQISAGFASMLARRLHLSDDGRPNPGVAGGGRRHRRHLRRATGRRSPGSVDHLPRRPRVQHALPRLRHLGDGLCRVRIVFGFRPDVRLRRRRIPIRERLAAAVVRRPGHCRGNRGLSVCAHLLCHRIADRSTPRRLGAQAHHRRPAGRPDWGWRFPRS